MEGCDTRQGLLSGEPRVMECTPPGRDLLYFLVMSINNYFREVAQNLINLYLAPITSVGSMAFFNSVSFDSFLDDKAYVF